MLTYQDQISLAQEISGDSSASREVIFKRDINEGGAMFMNRLGRKFNKEYKTTNLIADRQYYQLPSDVLRISEIRCLNGTNYYTPELITSEELWNDMNTISTTGSYPTHYYIRGFNEIGLYPIPSTAVTSGMVVSFEPQHVELTQDDYITGTITVTNGAVAITHSATGFSPQMVGRWCQVTDGTDGKWYRVGSYVSSSVLNLENYYEGISGAGRAFRIGEVMKVPQAYQDAPVFYALDRYYLTQNDKGTAADFATRFDLKVRSAKETYGRSTSRLGVKSRHRGRQAKWIDLTPPIIYP
ncbi:MAG: hypothetical protein ABIR46_03160 [Candidatus Saccharimonadales bacterium]